MKFDKVLEEENREVFDELEALMNDIDAYLDEAHQLPKSAVRFLKISSSLCEKAHDEMCYIRSECLRADKERSRLSSLLETQRNDYDALETEVQDLRRQLLIAQK